MAARVAKLVVGDAFGTPFWGKGRPYGSAIRNSVSGFLWALYSDIYATGAFLAAAVWGGQWGGHIFIWGGAEFRMT